MRSAIYSACLLLLISAGCRTQPHVNAHIESVNAEYRELEDYVYCLEEENARLQQEMDAVRRGAVSPAATGGAPSGVSGGLFRRRPTGGSTVPGPVNPAPSESIPDLPRIEDPGGASPTPPPRSRSEVLPPADTKVTHLFMNPLLTGGADFDGQPGDEGLALVLEPRNASDEYVPQAGAISVAVLDPSREGDAARIARWDFDLAAARQLLAESSPARGLKLELPWPAAPPANTHLKVFVRYETSDGRKLQTDREIDFTPPGTTATVGWTPRTGPAIAQAAEPAPINPPPAAPIVAAPPPQEEPPLSAPAALSAAASSRAARSNWSPNR